jgi:hypothetical protein
VIGFGAARRSWLIVMAAAAISMAGLMASPSAGYADAPPWGACGRSTPEDKLVRQYMVNPRLNFSLRCGNAQKGYRHIVSRHLADFQRMAAGTYTNWRDVADLAMESIARDPDVAVPAGGGTGCYSRVLFLRNLRTNQVVRQQVFTMIVIVSTGEIITAYPSADQCRR